MGGETVIPDEARWIARIAAGDRAAFALLYDRFSPQMLALGVLILRSRAEAEDVLHDVFIEVWKRAADYDAARGTVRAWLSMRMRSRALDRQKSPRVKRAVALDDEKLERTAGIGTDPDLRLERARVRAALSALSAEQRETVELQYFVGLSTQEIAERLGVPSGTVKSRLSAARERLRGALADRGSMARAAGSADGAGGAS